MIWPPAAFDTMIETFSMVAFMSDRLSCQMQPRGLGMPAIFAAVLAGPLGNSW